MAAMVGEPMMAEGGTMQVDREWSVLTDEEASEIAAFGGITVEKVRGIELLVLMKAGKVTVAT
jgi:hypothetical protein